MLTDGERGILNAIGDEKILSEVDRMNNQLYKNMMEELNAGKKAVVVTELENQHKKMQDLPKKILLTDENLPEEKFLHNLEETVCQKVEDALESGNLQFYEGLDGKKYLLEPYFPEPHLIVFGGGHIAKPLVEFGARLGFLITVIDDRPSFANRERFPDAEKVICEDFKKSFDLLNINESTYVVIVTRGHRHDLDCLKQALQYNTAYLGMIGSKRRVKEIREQLINEGYGQEQLDKVRAPIGLEIGAVTPEEIGISILAQVVSYRRLGAGPSKNIGVSKRNWPDTDPEVIRELANGIKDPKALVTIISTRGSVPRKAGAKMLVWPHGKIVGSIGGGCSEGEVIHIARDVIKNKGYQILDVDMTGKIAEEEGMVCGGVMKVIIEYYGEG